MQLVRFCDNLLNRITMYRLITYGLVVILGGGFILSFFGQTGFSVASLVASCVILSIACYVTNRVLAFGFDVPWNAESSLITTLILACIVQPPESIQRAWAVVLVGLIAMASKYLLTLRQQHIFNPVAIAALVVGLSGLLPITWWIATPALTPLVAIMGCLFLRKTRHFLLFGIFLSVSVVTLLIVGLSRGQGIQDILSLGLLSWPLIFFGTLMLTEPMTMPSERSSQMIFAGLVGVLFAAQLKLGPLTTTPQLALVVGNIFAFALNPRGRFLLTLQSKREIAPQVYEFKFKPRPQDQPRFQAGQYLDWTLPHSGMDSRGNRRSFTIASSPTESTMRLGVKFYDPSSSYKKTLHSLKAGETILTSRLSGSFTLPSDPQLQLAFIAGGIGITPFRSMIKYLIDTKQERDMTLFHLITTAADATYKDILLDGKKVGLKTRYIVNKGALPARSIGQVGELTPALLKKSFEDLSSVRFYISGPPAMVNHYVSLLRGLGCKRRQIVTDFFSGY